MIRRLTLARWTIVLSLGALTLTPLLIGLGAGNADPVELESLRVANESLKIENESYRAATGELAEQISSLQSALTQLGSQAELDPAAKAALERLPAMIRSRAAGGGPVAPAAAPAPAAAATMATDESPDTTIGVLKGLLGAIESRLSSVRTKIESQQALARATPSIWPLAGWLSSGFGSRKDPFNGANDFHEGLDIAADKGTPVRATADGVVESAAYNGAYGNAVLINHGFGISTRFGHLSAFAVRAGQQIHRGDVVGFVGSTGHATGPHLHYEILFNGQQVNPLRLLARP
ncbi:MAG TPA: peptidoglycan DD-metalloendopeptidase family protein [Vicinamibacterales bacterium]|nr:peptidoglycan DD-metalloendopeptidase family protein [Vicinamibacterales bacterium]